MFSAKQFSFTGPQDTVSPFTPLETQLAAFQDLSQLLSEDIDRYTETCNNIWQNLTESIWQQQLDLISGKPSDELVMNLNARLQALFEQSSQAQLSLHSIVDDAMKKATELFAQTWQLPQQVSISMPFAEFNFAHYSDQLSAPKLIDITAKATSTVKEKATEVVAHSATAKATTASKTVKKAAPKIPTKTIAKASTKATEKPIAKSANTSSPRRSTKTALN